MSEKVSTSVVFLVGAGFSKSADLPLSIELAEGFKKFIVERSNAKGPKSLKLLHFYIEGGIRFQLGKLGVDPSGNINIEQIAIAARHLHARERNPIAPFVAGWHPHLLQLLAIENNLLDDYLECFYAHLHESLGEPDQAKIAFIDRLAQTASTYGSLDIFSLNYDCCIERALQPYCDTQKNITLIDGFTEQGWHPELFNAPVDSKSVIRLFKMHGSLNWVNSQEFGLVNVDKLPAERAMELAGMQPHLIFGTDVKLTGEQPFFSMAHLLYEKLTQADVFVVIGYSFGDGYVNAIISQAQRTNTKLRVMNVSPSAHQGIGSGEHTKEIRIDLPVTGKAGDLIQNYELNRKISELVRLSSQDIPF